MSGDPVRRAPASTAPIDAGDAETRQPGEARRIPARAAIVLLLLFTFALIVRNAWLSDDAYITFRTVDNFVRGYGLTWNVGERVQVYTHPLWMFLMAGVAVLTGELFYTSLAISIVLSMAAVALLAFRLPVTSMGAVTALVIFSLSKAFIDYATSGLENPLTHLLLAAFLLAYLDPARSAGDRSTGWLLRLSLLAALVMLNRLDAGLLVLPALGYALWETRSWRSFVVGAVGLAPIAVWTAFSLFYYGSPVPNTALAKLNAGLIPAAEIRREGLFYLLNSWRADPITLGAIGVGVVMPLVGRAWRKLPLAAGCLLYLAYIVRVGGDFMSGRFLTAPLFLAVAVWATTTWWSGTRPRLAQGLLLVACLGVGLTTPYTPLRAPGGTSADDDPAVWVRGRSITDERANYYPVTGLLPALARDGEPLAHDWAEEGRRARGTGPRISVRGSVGFYGYETGPEVHVVDLLGLGDPLLARLPVTDPNWQIGHFGRRPPEGYLETLERGENRLRDAGLAAYYEVLATVTRGDLWDPARWREVWRLNAGRYDHLIDGYAFVRGPGLHAELEITNPTAAPYVYAYVWNHGAGETWLLDDASVPRQVYHVGWRIAPTGVTLEGDHLERLAAIGALSDGEPLNVGVIFAKTPSLGTDPATCPDPEACRYQMYEVRYWFRLGEQDPMTVLMPGLAWYNGEAPEGYWREVDAGAAMRVHVSPLR